MLALGRSPSAANTSAEAQDPVPERGNAADSATDAPEPRLSDERPAPPVGQPARAPSHTQTKPQSRNESQSQTQPSHPVESGTHVAQPAANPREQSQGEVQTISYVVVRGDSLTKLSKQYGCTVTELAKLNKIKPNSGLWIGQKLKIPAAADATR